MTLKKLNVDICLPEFNVTKIVFCKFHIDFSTNSRYNVILGRELLTSLLLDIKFSRNVIICGEGPYEGFLSPMVDVRNYDFIALTEKYLNRKNHLLTRIRGYINDLLIITKVIGLITWKNWN